ncbi:MAG TPA: GNAT family protein [Anaerolineaceae bacterium]
MPRMVDFLFPDLESSRLRLRRLVRGDLDFLFAHFSDAQVGQFLVDEDPVTTREDAAAILDFCLEQDGKGYNRWLMVRKDGGIPLGTLGFHHWDRRNRHAEIGYDLSPQYWGEGFMREAALTALNFAFSQMLVHRVEAMIHVENARSIRLAEGLGFQREGCLRGNFLSQGVYHDHYLYALLAEDYERISSNARR